MTIPPPPPGFELEPMGQGAAMPPPPPGFELITDDITDLPQVNALPPDFSGVTATVDSSGAKPKGNAVGRFLGQFGGREVLQASSFAFFLTSVPG